MALSRFVESFHNKIAQLVFTFPEDASTSTGTPFWSAPKRFPHALTFSSADASHLTLIRALSNLKAEVHGVARPAWVADDAALAKAADAQFTTVPVFAPKSGVKIETDPKATAAAAASAMGGDDEAIIEDLLGKLEAARAQLGADYRLAAVEFEKDDDTNFHIDFITAASNLRAANYKIAEADKLKTKQSTQSERERTSAQARARKRASTSAQA